MRRILQSKTAVSCLAAIAVLSLAADFAKWPNRRALSAAARESTASAENGREESFTVPPVSRVQRELSGWREMFSLDTLQRDPFAAITAPSPAAVTNVATMPVFHLQAISIDGDRILAVINQKVLAEGEQIEGCRVEKILPTEVHLTSPLGPITATFHRSSRLNKSPSGNPSAADLPASSPAVKPDGNGR
jgi:type II secretory pathway component PulC